MGGGEREIQRGASINPLNLPATAQARMWRVGGGGEGNWLFLDSWSKVSSLLLASLREFASFQHLVRG